MAERHQPEPLVTFTQAARERIGAFLKDNGRQGHAIRLSIEGRSSAGFRYGLGLADPDEVSPDDTVVDCGDFQAFIDAQSAPKLKGAVVDFVGDAASGGFNIENPNPVWDDPKAMTVQQIIDAQINPAIAAHGGSVELLDVKGGVVYVRLGGGCQGCGMVDVTLKHGIAALIKEALPEIEEIIDSTDHAAGTNPYYQPAKT